MRIISRLLATVETTELAAAGEEPGVVGATAKAIGSNTAGGICNSVNRSRRMASARLSNTASRWLTISSVSVARLVARKGSRTLPRLRRARRVPGGTSIQASASPSVIAASAAWVSGAMVTSRAAGQSAAPSSDDRCGASRRSVSWAATIAASGPDKTTDSSRGCCVPSSCSIAVRSPSTVARATMGYAISGSRNVMNTARRSRTNSSKSRRAIAEAGGSGGGCFMWPPLGRRHLPKTLHSARGVRHGCHWRRNGRHA